MPRKPGGKYKGKIGRAKGEATIAAELEARRRKAYEQNLARLQERRQAELLAEQGLMNDEEEEQAQKLAKIAQMFGQGKKSTYKKFFKNWKIGIIQIRKERIIHERQKGWRRSCAFCDKVPVQLMHRHGDFSLGHEMGCKGWWTNTLGRSEWGQEMHAKAASQDRPDVVNDYRMCTCCGVDTGLTGLGCRSFHGLKECNFMSATELQATKAKHAHFSFSNLLPAGIFSGRSASTPSLRAPATPRMTLSVEENWARVRQFAPDGRALEYDPSEAFKLSDDQAYVEERRAWSDDLTAMAGSPTRRRGGQVGLLALPPLMTTAPTLTEKRQPMDQVAHWRTGQKTVLDKHMMKMYVVGTQQ